MTETLLNNWVVPNTIDDDLIESWMESFIIDRKIQNLAPGTIHFYVSKLKLFLNFCNQQSILYIHQLTPNIIRQYLGYLADKGHNPGGIHGCFRTLRTFLYWWEEEVEPEGWKNPIRKVKAPKVAVEPLDPTPIGDIEKLIKTCSGQSLTDIRDKAILYVLLDTGARAAELCAMNLNDLDSRAGTILIRRGKGRKPRMVFLGQKTKQCLKEYLDIRIDESKEIEGDPLWITKFDERLSYWGLNLILKRRAKLAKIEKPELHGFRRAFALNYLRNGGDIYTLQKLMGHADLQVLRRYLAQTNEDLQIAHNKFSPVDNSRL